MQSSNEDIDTENRLGDTAGKEEGGMNWEGSIGTKTLPYIKWTVSGNLLYDTGSSNLVLYENFQGWDGVEGGREAQEEEVCVYLWLIHVAVWQNHKYCKATILRLKNKLHNMSSNSNNF